jgi:hypothetical protein
MQELSGFVSVTSEKGPCTVLQQERRAYPDEGWPCAALKQLCEQLRVAHNLREELLLQGGERCLHCLACACSMQEFMLSCWALLPR